MDIRIRPLVIATLVGLIPLLLYTAVSTALSFLLLPNMMESIDPVQGPDPEYFQLTSLMAALGCAGTVLTVVLYAAVGLVYAYLHHRETDVSAEEGAVGGAIGAGLVAFINGLLGAIVTLALTPMIFNSIYQTMPGPAPQEMQGIMGIATIFGALSSAISLCFSALFAALIGALGGVIGGAVWSRRSG